jgi:iron complex outermembrane receptor protein
MAQQVSGALIEEITVTVRRREETIKDVPATVYVFTESDIERSNITRARDIAYLTPGLSIIDAAEVADTQVNIRGMNGSRDAEVSYALIIDGIQMTNPAALNREYSNLQQIEILKGPQGALYGRNAAAGAFIISTQKPTNDFSGRVNVSAGEDATYRVAADIGGAISPDKVFYALNAEYRTSDGFYFNEWQQRDDITDNFENWAIGGRLIFEPTEKLTIDTKLRYGEVDAAAITFNASFHLPTIAAAFGSPLADEDPNNHDFRFQPNITSFNNQEALEFSVKLDYEMDWGTLTGWGLYSDVDNNLGSDGTSAAFEFFGPYWDSAVFAPDFAVGAGDALCNSTTADFFADPSPTNPPGLPPPQFIGGPLPSFPVSFQGPYLPTTCDGTQYQERNQEDFSFEFRLTSPGDQRFRWMGGIYYLNIDREVGVNLGIDRINPTGQNIGQTVQQLVSTDPSNPTEQLVHDNFTTDVYSAFGQVAWDFTDSLEGTFALRYDREEREVDNLVPNFISPEFIDCNGLDGFAAPGDAAPPAGNGPTNAYDGGASSSGAFLNPGLCITGGAPLASKSEDFTETQPKLSLSWDATDNWTFYGSYGVGFKAGGFNNQGSRATVDSFINIPLGLCDPSVAGCVASGQSRVGIEDQYRKETSENFEIGLKSTLFDNKLRLEAAVFNNTVDDMQFFEFLVGSFGLLRVVENIDEVELQGFELAASWTAASWLDLFVGGSWIDSEINENRVRPDTVGNESPATPEFTANASAYLNFPITSNMNFFTNLNYSMVGETWFHVVQDQVRPTVFNNLIENRLGPVFPPFTEWADADLSKTRRDSYGLLHVRLGLESERWTLAIWGNNATDESYLEEVILAPEFGGSFIHPGTQSRWGADVTWRFGS